MKQSLLAAPSASMFALSALLMEIASSNCVAPPR